MTNSTTMEPLPPAFRLTPAPAHVAVDVQFGNLLNVESTGVEIDARWMPVPQWRLDASYANLRFVSRLDPGSLDQMSAGSDGESPRHQWQLRTAHQLTRRLEFNGAVYHVGAHKRTPVPSYTRADASVRFALTPALAIAGVGQNLLQVSHLEFWDGSTGLVGSQVPRSGRLQLRWQF